MAAKDDDRVSVQERRAHLADLVRTRRLQMGLGLERFAARAVDPESGVTVKSGWINRLEQGDPVKAPGYEELCALAAACDLPVERLQDAAGQQFFGIDPVWSSSGEAKAFVRRVDRYSPRQREQLRRLMDALELADPE
jgi:transcriptional regulator with XRE-family HTH domain